MNTLAVSYDADSDVLTIEGTRYAGSLFRALGAQGFAVGARLEIIARDDGVISLRRWYEAERQPGANSVAEPEPEEINA